MGRYRLISRLSATVLAVAAALSAAPLRAGPAEDLQAFAQAYAQGDLLRFANLFAPPEPDRAYRRLAVFNRFRQMWRAARGQPLFFKDVTIHRNGRISAWFSAGGPAGCSGLMEIDYRGDKWHSLGYECYSAAPVLDGASWGQAADVATTAAALSSGAAEANPLAAGVLEAGGVPLLAGVKLAVSEGVEHLEAPDCRAWKDGLATAGFAATGWNLAVLAGAGSGVGIPLALVGAVVGHDLFRFGNAVQCRSHDRIDYLVITGDSIIAAVDEPRHQGAVPAPEAQILVVGE